VRDSNLKEGQEKNHNSDHRRFNNALDPHDTASFLANPILIHYTAFSECCIEISERFAKEILGLIFFFLNFIRNQLTKLLDAVS